MALEFLVFLASAPMQQRPLDRQTVLELLCEESDFPPLPPPKPGQWRAVFSERRQSFQQYVASRPIQADEKRKRIIMQPIGSFPGDKKWLLQRGKEYAEIFFDCKVILKEPLPLPKTGWRERQYGKKRWKQYRTDIFLRKILPNCLDPESFLCLGVTMEDLYPEESWNFVFGQASIRDRVGIYSLARYFPSFYGEEDPPARSPLILRRVLKVLSHETCHMLGMHHCVDHPCLMNGSNSLEESDARPLHLCGLCLRKLAWNRNFDPLKRYERLMAFYDKWGLKDDARWVEERLKKVEKFKKKKDP